MNFVEAPARRRPACPSRRAGVHFVGDRRAYWRLLIRGAALLAVTLGIYRFWFATDMRRFLWSNTEIAGETLEYTGTPIELLIGFLIAIALLVPLYRAFAVAGLELGISARSPASLGFVALPLRSVRGLSRPPLSPHPHRLSRRPLPPGRLGVALCRPRSFWWAVLILLTLGLAYPFTAGKTKPLADRQNRDSRYPRTAATAASAPAAARPGRTAGTPGIAA